MAYLLGIDAGGSKTEAALSDGVRVLARAQGESVKVLRVPEVIAEARLEELLERLSTQAHVALREVTATCAGASGASVPRVKEWLEWTLIKMTSGRVEVCGDEEIALDAAFEGGPGALVIAGTGSNAVARDALGRMFRAGGWGPAIGDEGSGVWIGREAVRRAAREKDERGESALMKVLMHAWGCETVDELVARAHGEADWAALAPAVGRAARDGDELARIILRHAGEELAWLAAMMAQQARVTEIAWTGNVLARIDGVGAAMQAALSREVPGVRLMDEPADSVMGALWRANRLARS